MNVKELENAITQLSKSDFDELMCWLDDYREELWDKQIAADSAAGRLDHLMEEAKRQFEAGNYREL